MEKHLKVYAALVHETVKSQTFDTIADLTDVVKTRCAKLRLPYDGEVIAAAIDHVAQVRKTPLVNLRLK